jgi:hypothetical protein
MVRRRELSIRYWYGAFALVQMALCSVEWWWGRGLEAGEQATSNP